MVRLVSGSLLFCFFESWRCSLPSFPKWSANGLWFSSLRPSETTAACFTPTSTPTTARVTTLMRLGKVTKTVPECPRLFKRARNARSLRGGLSGTLLRRGHSNLVAIAIAAMNWRAEPMANSLHSAGARSDVKGATGPHHHPPNVNSLSAAMSSRSNEQRHNPNHLEQERRALANTGGVNPVLFRQVSLRSVVFRQAARPALNGQTQGQQTFVQGPPGRIDGGRIPEGSLCLSQDASQQIRFVGQKDTNLLRPFGLVARLTGKGEVANSIRSPIGSGLDVLDLKRDRFRATIATSVVPLEG